jgi:hypothetical protein
MTDRSNDTDTAPTAEHDTATESVQKNTKESKTAVAATRKRTRHRHENHAHQPPRADPYQEAYRSIVVKPHPDSSQPPRPGSPSRYFQSSYIVQHYDDDEHQQREPFYSHVVHQHANGLVIVTAPSSFDSIHMNTGICAVPRSVKDNKKMQAKMLRGVTMKQQQGIVHPNTVLAVGHRDGATTELRCGVWGTCLEVHAAVSNTIPSYLAIVLPTGPFPPRKARDEAWLT